MYCRWRNKRIRAYLRWLVSQMILVRQFLVNIMCRRRVRYTVYISLECSHCFCWIPCWRDNNLEKRHLSAGDEPQPRSSITNFFRFSSSQVTSMTNNPITRLFKSHRHYNPLVSGKRSRHLMLTFFRSYCFFTTTRKIPYGSCLR